MSPRYDDEWTALLLDADSRFGYVRPEDLLAESGMGEGQVVVDVGCGPGLLTLAASSVVGSTGKVYAVDIERKMLDMVAAEAEGAGLGNIETVYSAGDGVPLPDELADYVICSQVLHYPDVWDERVEIARDAARMVRPNGRMLIVEWVPQEDGTDRMSRLTPERVKEILKLAGLRYDNQLRLGDRQYAVLASRPAAAASR